ncbi:M61 family metallopeptidase [Sphingomonas sp. GCM10030256]|uniref:M61 family metallopeptidase n=1 Tax=Sphingomonas sp. GCM10030256 TaxID=3273427 RepID=UPI0036132F76
MRLFVPFAALMLIAPPALAQNSAPQPVPIVQTIPEARDVPYPGTMTLEVDATDTTQGIWKVRQRIPVAQPGRMTLLYPQWLPGNHAPRGEVEKLAGLVFRAGGQVLPWTRDPLDMFAFHIDVPAGATEVVADFQFLTATAPDQGRILVTREMLNLQFEDVSLYPAGYFTRQIPVTASVSYPAGWQAATALRPPGAQTGNRVTYGTVSYETLQDSPVFAGKYFRRDELGLGIALNSVADHPKELAIPAAVLQKHRNLVTQAVRLFGARHYDHYDFLHAVTERMGGIGLEHHRSSENQNDPGYFIDWDNSLPDHNLLPHELVHSWNGKFRRGADLFTPDFRTPMRDSLLWVYEGQTQFWGYVLEARSGMSSKQDVLDKLAVIAANFDVRRGREWRALQDTTNDPIISARRPKGWTNWQRSEDYYAEGMLVWLEADAIIRQGTRNRRGMDDFAKAFFGIRDGDWGVVTYTFDDVVSTLNRIHPHDWRTFLITQLTETGAPAPLGGFTRSGYRLTYAETPTKAQALAMKSSNSTDLSYSLGLSIDKDAKITSVIWGSPAFAAGLTVGQTVVAVDGRTFSADAIKERITAAKGGTAPIRLTVKRGEEVRDVPLQWNGGLRYPRFTKTGGRAALDILLEPK